MAYLFDTNCFLRLAERNSPQRVVVLDAIHKLRAKNETLNYTPQILAEFWNVCTKSNTARGGFGLSVEQTERKVAILQKYFALLPDNRATFNEWQNSFRIIKSSVYKFTIRKSSLQ